MGIILICQLKHHKQYKQNSLNNKTKTKEFASEAQNAIK